MLNLFALASCMFFAGHHVATGNTPLALFCAAFAAINVPFILARKL